MKGRGSIEAGERWLKKIYFKQIILIYSLHKQYSNI